jgi:cytochrome c553
MLKCLFDPPPENGMTCKIMFTFVVGALALTGCSDLTRSRDLANPQVSAITLAQQVCSSCHGLTGNAISPNFPNLAGQTPTYLAAQLRAFKSHGRSDPAGFEYMWGLSRGLADAQIDGLAAYYAGQIPARQPVEGSAAHIASGKMIYETGLAAKNVTACAGCHGKVGQGNDAFPRLAGQHADYVVKQLLVFQRTDERPDGAMMKTIAHELTPQDIENVAAYVQTMP